MPRRLRRDQLRRLTSDEYRLATHGPIRLKRWPEGCYENAEAIAAWDDWNAAHGPRWRAWHGVRMSDVTDVALFDGPAPPDPPGWAA